MIQTGDKFSAKDLAQSIHELRSYDVQKYLAPNVIGVSIGNSLIMPAKCTPDEYAATCINEYNGIPSSATELDKQLRDHGFKTTYRFSHKYKTPGLSTQQIIHDAYCLDWFRQIYATTIPNKKYQNEYVKVLTDAFCTSYYYAQYLWTFNRQECGEIARQLAMPDEMQWDQIISAILGIGFQFHPYDVYEYSIEHINPRLGKPQFDARYAQQLEFKNEMETNFGIDTGCLVLSPKNREKLQKIVTRTDTPYWIQVIQNLAPWHNR